MRRWRRRSAIESLFVARYRDDRDGLVQWLVDESERVVGRRQLRDQDVERFMLALRVTKRVDPKLLHHLLTVCRKPNTAKDVTR